VALALYVRRRQGSLELDGARGRSDQGLFAAGRRNTRDSDAKYALGSQNTTNH
jgi:hypothetical protein